MRLQLVLRRRAMMRRAVVLHRASMVASMTDMSVFATTRIILAQFGTTV
jgi:uncharacterized protein (DUF2147 family)